MVKITYDTQCSNDLFGRLETNTVDGSHEVCCQPDNTDHRDQTQSSDAEEGLAKRKSTVAWDRHIFGFDRLLMGERESRNAKGRPAVKTQGKMQVRYAIDRRRCETEQKLIC